MVGLGTQVDMAGGLAALNKEIRRVQIEIRKNAERALKEELELFAPKLQDYLQKEYQNFYDREVESEYYNRTGDITRTIKVKVSQGGGYYGLKLWFDQIELEVRITPKGQFNAHADFSGHPITVEQLLALETDKKQVDFIKEFHMLALKYVKENLIKNIKVSFNQDFEAAVFAYGM
jgi:hypothetical protein